MSEHDSYMQRALQLAAEAEQAGEVPVGAVIVYDGNIIAEAYNQPIIAKDPTAHAEIIAMRHAAKILDNYRLINCDLYVTLQPCAMCQSAMIHARIRACYFGAYDSRQPATPNHHVELQGGILEQSCSDILKIFFQTRR